MAAGCNIGAHDIIFDPQCQRKNKIFNTLLKFCLLWTFLVPATAQVYKWVDEKGTTHYGERPPQGRKAEEIGQRLAKPGADPEKTAQPDWNEKELEFRKRRIEAEQEQTRREQQEASNRQACNQARDRLAQAKAARRLYRLDDSGKRVYQDESERQASMARLEALIAEHCR
jgi:hypothetical protein